MSSTTPSTRRLEELRDVADPAWPELQARVQNAFQWVQLLPPTSAKAGEEALLRLQLSADTMLGAMVLHTGGLLVDGGWLRLLGAGSVRMQGSVLNWNGLEHPPRFAGMAGCLIVGHDVLGGLFAVNAGGLPGPEGHAFYLNPATLEWQDLDHGYTGLVEWALDGDLQSFYNHTRWDDWEDDLDGLSPDYGLIRSPLPWTLHGQRAREGKVEVVRMGQLIEAHVRRLKGPEKADKKGPPVAEA